MSVIFKSNSAGWDVAPFIRRVRGFMAYLPFRIPIAFGLVVGVLLLFFLGMGDTWQEAMIGLGNCLAGALHEFPGGRFAVLFVMYTIAFIFAKPLARGCMAAVAWPGAIPAKEGCMKRPEFKGRPVTKWIGSRQRYRINFAYCTPWGQCAVPVFILGFVAMVLAGWLLEEVRPPITGILVVDVALMMAWSTVIGFLAAAVICSRRERIEISGHSITFGKPPYKRAYSVLLPREFLITPLPPPHPTGFHKNAVVLALRFGQHEETFTVWNGFQDAEDLIERFEAVLDAVQERKQPDRERFIQRFFAARSSRS